MGLDEWGSVQENGDSKRPPSEYEPPTSQSQNHSEAVDLKGRPVDKSKTGTWRASPFLNAINVGDFQAAVGVPINLVPYLAGTMHQPVSEAANITTNFLGTSYLVAVLGGFLADSYIGAFFTICAGGTLAMSGLGLLVLSTALAKLQPAPCASAGPCKPAGARYMAPLYVALYALALGSGLVKPNKVSLGGDQFDDSSPKERKQGVRFFVWFYGFTNVGLFMAFTLGVYLQDDVSRSWGYGFSLMLYAACFLFFIMGAGIIRHQPPTGSFLTRMAQVILASLRKSKAPAAADPKELYNPPVSQLKVMLSHTSNFRFLDKAATIDEVDKNALAAAERPNAWRLCSVTQVEESKRLIQFIPVWITLAPVTLVFSQLSTFTVQQGATLDRKLGHLEIPPASLGLIVPVVSLLSVPIYEILVVRVARRYTKSPYGFLPLQRLGLSLGFAIITMVCAALVERKRLTYVRDMQLQALPLGAFVLPMRFWYLIPQFIASAQVEFFLYVASYQFFYHEAAQTTRSVGSSFTYAASSMGYFFSTIIVKITNHVTNNAHGGSWLKERLNNGGLENFYWLLSVVIAVDLLLFMVAAHFYQYKYDWYRLDTFESETEGKVRSISAPVTPD